MDAFFAQLGDANNRGLFTDVERLQTLTRSENPFITGNSFGRI